MASSYGMKYKLTLFGESHGSGVGIVIDGIPAGFKIDFEEIRLQMARRRPGLHKNTTTRVERDEAKILSGYYNEHCTGAPLTAFIESTNIRPKDYSIFAKNPRPGHADYSAWVKYNGFNDIRGGGMFSGRLTAPIVFAGVIAKQILRQKGITIGGHIMQVGNIKDTTFNPLGEPAQKLNILGTQAFPVCDKDIGETMQNKVAKLKESGDSIGGIVECMAIGLNAGVGDPFFNSIESTVAHLAFSIPGVKGIEFGKGFELAKMQGSNSNDCYKYENGKVITTSNFNGGVLGGISTGMPIIYRTVFKATSSIAIKQNTINLENKENTELQVEGRHDPCIVLRAVPVMESVLAIALLDLII
ncbi:chorismate synthase [Clostridium sp. 'deep sea']|uniref:chorismate synthase n=1 Tax=Clostridium sp. 'deep sea' TaxID=2779445 RepID=UPI001896A465|nr:chorismate synthase [Clostridium sp. 'deep sea']QOR35564.1 chorismate synthase [Clostridium sp. 'deep sea']